MKPSWHYSIVNYADNLKKQQMNGQIKNQAAKFKFREIDRYLKKQF